MAPQAEAPSQALHFDPNGPGMGLDVDFDNFDSDVANFGFNLNNNDFKFDNFGLGTGFDSDNIGMNYSANFEDTLKEAESSLGPRETFQEANTGTDMNSPSHIPFLKLANENSQGTSTQEPVHLSEMPQMRAQKRKKIDEVDKGRILPEGSRRNRNKTARARGLD